jgi:hypothetical protein
MKKIPFLGFAAAAFVLFCFLAPVNSYSGVNVNVTIPLPPLVIPAPPVLTNVPGTYVYYPPTVGVDIFFYRGSWYRPYGGYWYRAAEYNGPWRGIAAERVPRAIVGVPPGFRRGPSVSERVPYGQVRTNWRAWERDRYWDRDRAEAREHQRGYESRGGHAEHGPDHEGHNR